MSAKTSSTHFLPCSPSLRARRGGLPARLKAAASSAAEKTVPMRAIRRSRVVSGRAQHRSHGSRRTILRVDRRRGHRRYGRIRMKRNVGIVIVSHSADVARGTALDGRANGPAMKCRSAGAAEIRAAAWVPASKRLWPRLSGRGRNAASRSWSISAARKTNSEMAIEMLPESRRAASWFATRRSWRAQSWRRPKRLRELRLRPCVAPPKN